MVDLHRVLRKNDEKRQVDGRNSFAIIFAVMGLAGCTTTPSTTVPAAKPAESVEAKVSARAKQRWDLMLKGDIDSAYGFLSPASRSVVTLDGFKNRNKPSLKSIEVTNVSCGSPEVCDVTFHLVYDLRDIKDLKRDLMEKWVFDEGQWWLAYQPRR